VVVAAVLVFLLIRQVTAPAAPPPAPPDAGPIVTQITSIPASELDQVGQGKAQATIRPIQGAQVLVGPSGKPEVFYMGAEYCPFCAAQRWPMIIALSRFGTFSALRTTTSSSTDVYPNTPTFTFHGSTYTSQYLDFVPVEIESNKPAPGGGYEPLDRLTPAQQALASRYDPGGSIPFVDFGNRYALSGSMYQPDVLQGMGWQQIASAVRNPSSAQARAILGAANLTTAALCRVTGQQPAGVCSSPAIQGLEAGLGG
jgi:hypothetical protein